MLSPTQPLRTFGWIYAYQGGPRNHFIQEHNKNRRRSACACCVKRNVSNAVLEALMVLCRPDPIMVFLCFCCDCALFRFLSACPLDDISTPNRSRNHHGVNGQYTCPKATISTIVSFCLRMIQGARQAPHGERCAHNGAAWVVSLQPLTRVPGVIYLIPFVFT